MVATRSSRRRRRVVSRLTAVVVKSLCRQSTRIANRWLRSISMASGQPARLRPVIVLKCNLLGVFRLSVRETGQPLNITTSLNKVLLFRLV